PKVDNSPATRLDTRRTDVVTSQARVELCVHECLRRRFVRTCLHIAIRSAASEGQLVHRSANECRWSGECVAKKAFRRRSATGPLNRNWRRIRAVAGSAIETSRFRAQL